MKRLFSWNSRWFLAVLVIAAMVMSVTGCNNSKGSAPVAADTPTATADPGAPPVAVDSPGTSPGIPGGVVNPEVPVPVPPPAAPAALTVQGNLVGDANAALTGAPLTATGTAGPPRFDPDYRAGVGGAG
jgi:hypothetical protein